MQQSPTIPQPGPEEYTNFSPQPVTSPHRPKEGWGSVISTILILLAAPFIALLLTAFVFQSYEVEGPSMETTLHNRDRLIVLKTGKTWSRLTRGHFIPKRGDIVVFEKSGVYDFGQGGGKQLIKRVIGLPGDRVVIKDGVVTVHNEKFPVGFQPDQTSDYHSAIGSTSPSVDISVGENEVFVLGDNRSNSLDSRSFGTIKSDDIVGTLALRIFPLNTLEAY